MSLVLELAVAAFRDFWTSDCPSATMGSGVSALWVSKYPAVPRLMGSLVQEPIRRRALVFQDALLTIDSHARPQIPGFPQRGKPNWSRMQPGHG